MDEFIEKYQRDVLATIEDPFKHKIKKRNPNESTEKEGKYFKPIKLAGSLSNGFKFVFSINII